MDTSKDFRILLAERGVKELEKALQNVKVQKRKELVGLAKNLSNELQILKYSYVSAEELANLCGSIVNTAKKVLQALKKAEEDFNKKTAEYWLEYLLSLPDLFKRGEIDRASFAVRYFSGEVISRSKVSENLWICVVDCERKFNVVTNSEKLANSEKAVVSFLPPRKFGEVVSEGMFVEAFIDKKGELSFEEVRGIAEKLGEVEAVLYQILRS